MLKKIISGGQTGADSGGLAAGIALNIQTGGWAPKGWKRQGGAAPWLAGMGLREHTGGYGPRTDQNAQDSDGTFWLGDSSSPGGGRTMKAVRAYSKPVFKVLWSQRDNAAKRAEFRRWLEEYAIETLNVAGNREEKQSGIAQATHDFIVKALRGE